MTKHNNKVYDNILFQLSNPNEDVNLSWEVTQDKNLPFRDQRDIFQTYKESFQVRWDNSIPLFLHAAVYLEVSLLRWIIQNVFPRETALYKRYRVQCYVAALHTVTKRLIERLARTLLLAGEVHMEKRNVCLV
jgi:hypothetical protein